MCVHVCVYTCVCMYMCVCTCVCVYMCVCTCVCARMRTRMKVISASFYILGQGFPVPILEVVWITRLVCNYRKMPIYCCIARSYNEGMLYMREGGHFHSVLITTFWNKSLKHPVKVGKSVKNWSKIIILRRFCASRRGLKQIAWIQDSLSIQMWCWLIDCQIWTFVASVVKIYYS